jgi:DNA-binding MarR family transcriptional regulator
MGAIADRLRLDPTTLNRNLKPLHLQGLVKDATDSTDRRVRMIRITILASGAGRARHGRGGDCRP